MTVLGRNRTLFCYVFRPHYRVESAVGLLLRVGLIHSVDSWTPDKSTKRR